MDPAVGSSSHPRPVTTSALSVAVDHDPIVRNYIGEETGRKVPHAYDSRHRPRCGPAMFRHHRTIGREHHLYRVLSAPLGLRTGSESEIARTDPAVLSGENLPTGIAIPSSPFAVGVISLLLGYIS